MLELVNITKIFNISGNKDDERVALDHVSLQIKPGEFVTVIGGNGSGKSTTLNVISGALKPDSGKVLLNGVDTTKMSEYSKAAYFGRVFQDPMIGTAGDMSIYENLEIAYARGRNHSPIKWGFSEKHKQYFTEELKKYDLDLENRLNQKVGLLSGGQRQALTLLMATMRQRPTEKVIKRDYVRFCESDKKLAKEEVAKAFDAANKELKQDRKVAKLNYKKNRKNYRQIRWYKINYAKSYLLDKKLVKDACEKAKKEYSDLRKNMYLEAEISYLHKTDKYDVTKQILLLDEHTAALDPKTASKVLDITERIVQENSLTTIMITHNMKDAIRYGNRLIMMSHGKVVVDVSGEEKQKLTVEDLLNMFQVASKDDYLSDSTILG